MRYFLDTEFIEYPCTIDLISIGIVSDDGRTYYAINRACDFKRANDWVKENVLTKLPDAEEVPELWKTRTEIKGDIEKFCNTEEHGKPEFWGYYADYDWVVFCWLFGAMIDLPDGWPMYCRDIKQRCDELGNPELPKQDDGEHNALEDAQWNQEALKFLETFVRDRYTGSNPEVKQPCAMCRGEMMGLGMAGLIVHYGGRDFCSDSCVEAWTEAAEEEWRRVEKHEKNQ